MPNPVKGEGVFVEINGAEYPLVFTYAAIAEIETKYDKIISEVQSDLPRISVLVDLLNAGLVGYDGDLLSEPNTTPMVELQMLIIKALNIAYFGNKTIEDLEQEEEPEEEKKKRDQNP